MIVEYWEKGKLKQRQATHAEEISHTEWHKPDKPLRIILDLDCQRVINVKKEYNDEIFALYSYFKSASLEKLDINDNLIIYLSEIQPAHEALIKQVGGKIESLNE